MPGMLGWFSLTSETTLEDVQWLLARAAGFDAGFCLVTNLKSVKSNPQSTDILAAVKAWESARRDHVFTPELLKGLQSVDEEFELSQTESRRWALQGIDSLKLAVGSVPFETRFNVSTSAEGSKVILQIPADVTLADGTFFVDGEQFGVGTPGIARGPRRFTLSLSHLAVGEHMLRFEGKLSGKPKAGATLEIRSPKGIPIHLTSSS
jgi:hypothetical protein